MPVVYNATLKNTRMRDVLTAMDSGVGSCHLKIYTAGGVTLLVDFVLPKPSCSLSADTLTGLGVPIGATGLANGTATVGKIFDGNGVLVVDQLTVGVNNSNINMQTVSVTTGQPNTLNSLRIVHG